ncbi:hypothetical protein GGI02_003945 [Coemansia sp. RSA 2322]|uniref:G protein-coupled receptor n=1 Tax=Coemansia thaxteri TaxID=2663907 RepID=A0A9W8BIW6_9FUNG|nr:hypothetical protein H4R26_002382 [Coemansia thaxteri]KAJ2467710.1 hypothetical protein GGI02_003945 [Coemansia sp. RSA 2322]
MSGFAWLTEYYCSVFDVLSPACGLSAAVSAVVLVSMYGDIADTVTVRVSGMLGLSDAMYQISQLIVRELAQQPAHQHFNGAARVFAFSTYFFQLLSTFLVSRIALDLQTNFLHWFACNKPLRWIIHHYARASVVAAFALACPLFFAPARFDPQFLYPQWSFGSQTKDILYMVFGFYLWVLLQLLNFAVVIVRVIIRLRRQPPSENNPSNSLATGVMRTLEHRMRRKARILVLYPLSPILFYSPALVFYWVQTLHLSQSNVTAIIWAISVIVGPLQAVFDLLVFAMLPPVQRIIRWYWILHQDCDMVPLVEHGHRESIFVGAHCSNVSLTTEERWVQDVTEPPHLSALNI